MQSIMEQVNGIYDELVALRRDFHAHPELSRQEKRTTKIIAEKLREYGLDEVHEGITKFGTGVVGVLKGTAGPGKCIAIRSDIDALPVDEQTGLPFSSQTPNVMHACGHDAHGATLLATAKLLVGMKDQLHGTVKFFFQPAEEMATEGGARPMLEAGVMENPKVDVILSGHIIPSEEPGKILLYKGGVTTGFDNYDIEVIGKSGHGSQPHTAKDAILAACEFVVAIQQIVSRKTDPLKTAIVSAGVITGGKAVNIIPDYCKIEVCVRAYESAVSEMARQQVFNIAEGIEKLSGCQVKVNHMPGYSAVKNDGPFIDLIAEACEEAISGSVEYMEKPMSFSEDYGRFIEDTDTPGAQIFFNVGHLGSEVFALHHPKFTFQEEGMKTAVAAFVAVAKKYLSK